MTASGVFGTWLKDRRKALDLTQRELARRAACAVITIQKLEAGERRPSKQIALALADCLGVPAHERAAFLAAARDTHAPDDEPMPHPPTLPVPPTPLFGRDATLAELRVRFHAPDVRLLTLVGPPGVGKTRLAIALAAALAPDMEGDVVYVALGAVEDAGLVMPTIARALELREGGDAPMTERLLAALRERHVLLVLDNFEQVAAAAPHLATLLGGCPHLRLLVTSRIALQLRGEHLHDVTPLAVPPSTTATLHDLLAYSAANLFVARAQAIMPQWAPTAADAPVVAAICARLDGIPLALELAAARLKVLSLPALSARLERQLPLLAADQRDVPPRHQTLRRAIEWSYLLLPPEAQRVLRHIAVYRGGCTLEAAAALLDAEDDLWLMDMLAVLIDHSLVRRTMGESAEVRFTMLASIREYAIEQLRTAADTVNTPARHASYFLELAERAEPELKGADQVRWFGRLADEHDNIRAALKWAWKEQDQAVGLRICGAMAWFWYVRSYYAEGRRWIEHFLRQADGEEPPHVAALALRGVALLCHGQGEYEQARTFFERSLELYLRLDDARHVALVRNNLGLVAYKQQRLDDAQASYALSLAQFRALDDVYGIASLQNNLGNLASERQDFATALACYTESLACYRALGHTRGIASVLGNLGDVALYDGDVERARAIYAESITIYRTLGDQLNTAVALSNLADLALRIPRKASVRRAARLYGASEALRALIGSPLPPQDVEQREEQIERWGALLPAAEWARAREEGSAWALEDALRYALATEDEDDATAA